MAVLLPVLLCAPWLDYGAALALPGDHQLWVGHLVIAALLHQLCLSFYGLFYIAIKAAR